MEDNFFKKKSHKKRIDDKYNLKIDKLIYSPNNEKPHISELIDTKFTEELIKKIKHSSVEDFEKCFLIEAAKRHLVFNYGKIADYYANASKEMQELMEDSGLVIIDFKKAIELGFVDLSLEVAKQYTKDKNNG